MADINRREVLTGAAAVAAASALPTTTAAAAVPTQAAAEAASGLVDLSIHVSGCGRACDCDWWLRCECPFWTRIRKLGDRFLIYDLDNNVVGEAEPGFQPLPDEVEWIAKIKYARAHGLQHPYDWPKKQHDRWDADRGRVAPARPILWPTETKAQRAAVIVRTIVDGTEQSMTTRDIHAIVRNFGMSHEDVVEAVALCDATEASMRPAASD